MIDKSRIPATGAGFVVALQDRLFVPLSGARATKQGFPKPHLDQFSAVAGVSPYLVNMWAFDGSVRCRASSMASRGLQAVPTGIGACSGMPSRNSGRGTPEGTPVYSTTWTGSCRPTSSRGPIGSRRRHEDRPFTGHGLEATALGRCWPTRDARPCA